MTENRESNEVFGAKEAKSTGFQARDVMLEDFGYTVPVDLVPLPSMGKVYPPESPLHNKTHVEVRAMTAKEEDILTSKALIKKGSAITELIKSCLVDKSIDVDSMISGDRTAIMVALRITGYGADYKVEVGCPACGESAKYEFDLAELPLETLQVDPVEIGENAFEFELPVTKKKVKFRLLNGHDEKEMVFLAERQKKQGQQIDNSVTQSFQYSIISIADITDKSKINMFIQKMPVRDSLALRKFMADVQPGVKMESHIECVHCGDYADVRLPLGANFFWPDGE